MLPLITHTRIRIYRKMMPCRLRCNTAGGDKNTWTGVTRHDHYTHMAAVGLLLVYQPTFHYSTCNRQGWHHFGLGLWLKFPSVCLILGLFIVHITHYSPAVQLLPLLVGPYIQPYNLSSNTFVGLLKVTDCRQKVTCVVLLGQSFLNISVAYKATNILLSDPITR